MEWKDLDWTDPPERLPQPIGQGDLKDDLLEALLGDLSINEKALEFLAANWSTMGEASSMPVSIQNGVLFVQCTSAPARQNLLLKFPGIQKEVQKRFSLEIRQIRFIQKASPSKAKKPLQKKSETENKKTDTVKSDPLIEDIRRILGL
jgi:hypothetical protein